jgi:hypothetical protein
MAARVALPTTLERIFYEWSAIGKNCPELVLTVAGPTRRPGHVWWMSSVTMTETTESPRCSRLVDSSQIGPYQNQGITSHYQD